MHFRVSSTEEEFRLLKVKQVIIYSGEKPSNIKQVKIQYVFIPEVAIIAHPLI